MKIVHVDTGKEMRGGQHQILLLADGLRQRGHEQLIVCPRGTPLEERARRAGFRVFALPSIIPEIGILQLWQALRVESFDLDIVHAHDGRGQNVAYLAILGRHARSVATRRVTFLPSGLASRLGIHRLKYDLTCHGIVAVSQFVRRLLVSAGVPEAKIEVIPDGIVVPTELPGSDVRARARAQWGFDEQEFVVGHAGAFSPEKGQEAAIAAVILLAEGLPNARLVLAGAVPEAAPRHLKALLDRAGDRVRLVGYIEDLSEFFAGLDL